MNVTALATRSDGWWSIEVPEIKGLFTQTRRLDQITDMVADAARLLEGIDPQDLHVDIQVQGDPESLAVKAREAKLRAQEAQDEATSQMRSAARDLSASGLAYRDIGTLLGVTHSYAQRLATS